MKRQMALGGLLLSFCWLGSSQTISPGRVVIPLRNSAGPRIVELSTTLGNITVRTHAGGDVIAESDNPGPFTERTRDGMHRIDIPRGEGLEVSEQDNVIHLVASRRFGNSNVTLTVPVETSLRLKTTLGNISVEAVHGEMDVTTTNGNIVLTNVSGTVVSSSTMGSQRITMDRIDQSKPLAFSSVNGSIDVTFPSDLKANLNFHTGLGEVWSDFDVTLTGQLRSTGMRHLARSHDSSMDTNLSGTINGGGVPISFHVVNGSINIRKKK